MKQIVITNKYIDCSSHYEKLANGEVRCIDSELPFEIPNGWEWVRMNELGIYRKGPFGSSLTKAMFVPKSETSIKVYEQKNAIQKDYRLGEYYISQDKYKSMQSFNVQPNDIIVSCAGTIGETYLLPKEAPVGIINQALMRVCLYHLPLSDFWQIYFDYVLIKEAKMKGAGSAIKNIPPFEYLKAILVPLPPEAEQKRIVKCYSELIQKVEHFENLREAKELLNASIYAKLKKSILQKAIQGKLVEQCATDEPASKLLERIREEKKQLVRAGKLKAKDVVDSVIIKGDDNKYYEKCGNSTICIDEEFEFEIPQGWELARIASIALVYTGNSISETEKKRKYTNVVGREYVGTKDVGFDCKVQYNNGIAIPKQYEDNFKIAPAESVLMCIEGGSAGRKIAIIDKDICFGNKLCCFAPFVNISKFIFYYLQSPFFFEMFNNGKTGIIGGVSVNTIKNMIIPIPPYQEMQRILAKLEQALASIMSR